MTTTVMTPTDTTVRARRAHPLRRATLTVGVGAAAAVTAFAAVAHAAGAGFTTGEGKMIPLLGFAQMTFVGAVLGGLLVTAVNRRSARPRHRFVVIASVLTVLSCIPSVALPPDTATKIALVVAHLLAAAIIVPVLARHARPTQA